MSGHLSPGSTSKAMLRHGADVAIPRDLFADILRMIEELRPPPLASSALRRARHEFEPNNGRSALE